MSRTRSDAPPPPTLRFLSRDVDAISAHCLTCGYKGTLPLAPLLERHGETPFPTFARKLKCSACGSREIEARPAWRNPTQGGGQ